jgi:hypothetical protein
MLMPLLNSTLFEQLEGQLASLLYLCTTAHRKRATYFQVAGSNLHSVPAHKFALGWRFKTEAEGDLCSSVGTGTMTAIFGLYGTAACFFS